MRMALKDIIFGAGLLVAALLVLFWLIPFGIDSPGAIANRALAPAFWPRIIVIGMIGLSVLLVLQGLLALRRPPLDPEAIREFNPGGELKMLVATAALFVYAWLLTWAGIVASSVLALIFFTVLHGERRIRIVLPVAILLPLALYLFFREIAQVPMPLGIFEGVFG